MTDRWPTQAQFDQAENHGIAFALEELAQGRTDALEAPLSGGWADGLFPRDVAYNVGWYIEGATTYPSQDQAYFDGEQALADAWETGYNSQWAINVQMIADKKDVAEITARNPEIVDVRRAP